ncbi:MAG: hypothetical protein ACKVHE_35615, partial [Planctomycetales bacterium]
LASNDQRVRSFTTVFRSDLEKRTFRDVVPYHPLESADIRTDNDSIRKGYIYISLNDPDNAVDNILQFTIRGSDFYGRSTPLVQRVSGGSISTPPNIKLNIRRNQQQPEFDDEELDLNFTARSTAAEVAYYVRGGRLYRRVILIRDGSTSDPKIDVDTVASPNVSFGDPPRYFAHTGTDAQAPGGFYGIYDAQTGGSVPSNDYWADFSFAAWADVTLPSFSLNGARLLGAGDDLFNNSVDSSSSLGLVRAARPNGIQCYRFGFDQSTGVSREFSSDTPADPGYYFLGRYTAEEMSHPDFNYPQAAAADDNGDSAWLGGSNPMSYAASPAGVPALVDANLDGTVDVLANGPRRGEDLLLSNVHAFEIDLWDDRQGAFVTPGHQLPPVGGESGDYHRGRNLQLAQGFSYVPGDPAGWSTATYDNWRGRVFDTWHPRNMQDLNGDSIPDAVMPPYRPTVYRLDDGSGPPDIDEKFQWQSNTPYQDSTSGPPSIVFPNSNLPQDSSLYYVCVLSPVPPATSGTSGAVEPNGPKKPGDVFSDGTVRWEARSNIKPLQAVRVRVRFLHEASGKMRQLSLVHSLID